MKRKNFNILMIAGVCFSFLLILGCSSGRISLVDHGVVTVEKNPSQNVKILWADVYQEGHDFIVSGALRRRDYTSYPLKAHVDIKILSPDRKVFQEARTPDIHLPRHSPGKGIHWKRFEASFPEIPQDAVVSVVAHDSLH